MKSKREKTKSHTLIKNVRSHISKEMGREGLWLFLSWFWRFSPIYSQGWISLRNWVPSMVLPESQHRPLFNYSKYRPWKYLSQWLGAIQQASVCFKLGFSAPSAGRKVTSVWRFAWTSQRKFLPLQIHLWAGRVWGCSSLEKHCLAGARP